MWGNWRIRAWASSEDFTRTVSERIGFIGLAQFVLLPKYIKSLAFYKSCFLRFLS